MAANQPCIRQLLPAIPAPCTSISSTIAETSKLSVKIVQIAANSSLLSSGDLGAELIFPSGTRSVLLAIRNGFGTADDLTMELMSNAVS